MLACSWPAQGQSLGQASGEVWIGQPLEVTIPARFQSADSRDTCVQAEVAYGDTRLAPTKVHTTVLGEDEHRRVRITTDQVVDEPLVTVTLRAGCGSTMTRSYTLLPDMPSEAVLARLMQPAPALARASVAAAPAMLATRSEARPQRLRLTPAVARMPAAGPALRTAKVFRSAPVGAAVPRLRLDAIEADAGSLLRVSAHLSQPGDAALRAQAALLWQALSADPQDLVRSDAALQRLEGELAQLRRTAGSTRAEMASLRQRIDQAQPWYLSPRMVQVLALLVLTAAGAAALFAWRTRRAAEALPWYQPGERAPLEPQGTDRPSPAAEVPPPVIVQRRADTEAPAQPSATRQPTPAAPLHAAAVAPATLQPLAFDLAPAADVGQPKASPRPAGNGLLRVETLAAILEEVEFLVSLGLHSDAMDVLKAYLEDSGSPAPAAFFELMRVCSVADDPQAVEAVRRRYAKVHGVPAPTLEQVSAEGGLEQQRTLAERVTRAWGSAEVLPLIEDALFAVPAPAAAPSVQAARDLICLYDIALVLATDLATLPASAQQQPLAPWAHAEHLGEAQAFVQAVAEDIAGHRFSLDLDLSVVPQTLPEKPPEPDAQELALRLLADKEAARKAAERAAREAEEAFNAAVASERAPISRY